MEKKFDERLLILALLFTGVAITAFMLGSKTAASGACVEEHAVRSAG